MENKVMIIITNCRLGAKVGRFYVFLYFLLCAVLVIGMIKPIWVIYWGKNEYKNRKKVVITYLIPIMFFSVLSERTLDQNEQVVPTNSEQTTISESQQHNEVGKSLSKTYESRNDFIVRIKSNPEKVDWTGDVVFSKVMQWLNNPQINIVQLFDGKITLLSGEEFYAGSYYLQGNLYCDQIWISNNDHLSSEIVLSGSNQDIKNIENIIESKLKKPSKEDYEDNHYKKGWYDKTYNNMKYEIEYSHDIQEDQSAVLIIHIHPQIYH